MDGHFSNKCYVRAVEACDTPSSERRANSIATADATADTNEHLKTVVNGSSAPVMDDQPSPLTNGHTPKDLHAVPNGGSQDDLNPPEKALKTSALDGFGYMCVHSPNCKLVARLSLVFTTTTTLRIHPKPFVKPFHPTSETFPPKTP